WYLVMSIMLKSELKNSSKVIAQLTGKPAPKLQVLLRELYQVWSANPAFLSIIACSPTLNGDIPAEFNANNVQIGALMPTPQQQQGSEFGGEQEKTPRGFPRRRECTSLLWLRLAHLWFIQVHVPAVLESIEKDRRAWHSSFKLVDHV
ncbi:unnamed protein product, partial [Durusdinium trenchii]